jgi:formylglycine-generating enzyme required for sulfatase activity
MGGREDDKFASAIELPRREVAVADFLLGRFPVTEAEWAAFRGTRSSSNLPVVGITWDEAGAYTNWLAMNTGLPCRLPTEAEWEYACRGGSETIFPGGNDLSTTEANFLYDESGLPVGAGRRLPVGAFAPNGFGLHDMTGNVCEWTADPWRSLSGIDPDKRTIRGGAWDHLPRLLRCSWRDWAPVDARFDNLGFRVAVDLPQ